MAELIEGALRPEQLGWLVLVILPLVLVSATSFVKMAVVFAALRNALGVPDLPSTLVITALTLVLTAVAMAPVFQRLQTAVGAPAAANTTAGTPLDVGRLWSRAQPIVGDFFRDNSDAPERALFVDLARERGREVEPGALTVLWPAFVLTELKEAFQMALLVVLPFLVVDLIVANVLLAVGMTALPPGVIALPFKLLLFVSVDGFAVLSRALVGGYA